MITEVYSIHDKGVNAFSPPFFARARGEALRSFMQACNDERHTIHNYPLDYSLCYLGLFDDASGILTPAPHGPERILGATEALKQE